MSAMHYKFSEQNTAANTVERHSVVHMHAQFMQLKNLYRQGWIKVQGVSREHAESVADHSFVTAMLALHIVTEYNLPLDAGRVAMMSLIHDICEVYAGDVTPHDDALVRAQKQETENESYQRIFAETSSCDFFLGLWEEFEQQDTATSRFVKSIDKLEFVLQALAYGRIGYDGMDVERIIKHAQEKIDDACVAALLDEIIKDCQDA